MCWGGCWRGQFCACAAPLPKCSGVGSCPTSASRRWLTRKSRLLLKGADLIRRNLRVHRLLQLSNLLLFPSIQQACLEGVVASVSTQPGPAENCGPPPPLRTGPLLTGRNNQPGVLDHFSRFFLSFYLFIYLFEKENRRERERERERKRENPEQAPCSAQSPT